MDRNYDVITFISKLFDLRMLVIAIFAEIIKIVTIFIKAIIKDSRKFKRIRNYVSELNLYMYFLL